MWQLFCQSVTVLHLIVKFRFNFLIYMSINKGKHSIKCTCVFYFEISYKHCRIKYNQGYQTIKLKSAKKLQVIEGQVLEKL